MKREKYSSAEILKGIRNGDHIILRYIYDNYYESIENMVLSKSGTVDLAHDVFQESLVVIFKKSQEKSFKINQSSFFTYFYAVCRFALFSIYEKGSKDVLTHSVELVESKENLNDFLDEQHFVEEGIKEHLFHKYLQKLSKNCLAILQLVMKGLKSDIIANQLEMSSAAYVRKKKMICLKNLVEMIKKDPKSNELL